jgi:MFS family permease
VVVLLLAILSQVSLQVARPLISYRLIALHASATSIGLVAAAFAVTPMFLALRMGALADRGWSVRLLVGGGVVMAAANTVLAVGVDAVQLAFASAALGLGQQALMMGMQALLAQQRDDVHDAHFGWFTAAISLGQVLGPLLGGLTLTVRDGASRAATQEGLLIAAGCAAVAVAVALTAPRSSGARAGDAPRRRQSAWPLLRLDGVVPGLLVSLTVLSCTDLLGVYLPVLGEHLGIGPAAVGVLLAVRAGTSMVTRLLAVPLLQRFSRSMLLAATAGLAAACTAAMPFVPSVPVLVLLMVGAGLGLGLGQPLTMTWIVRLVPPSSRGTALALRITGNRLGQAAVPAVAGGVAGLAGSAPVFWLMGVLLASSAIAAGRSGAALSPVRTPDGAGSPTHGG